MQELGERTAIGTIDTADVTMTDVWEPLGSLEDDSEEWVTEHSRSGSVYEQLEDGGIHEIHHHHFIPTPSDGRTCRDCTERQNQAWGLIYPVLMDAYLQWIYHGSPDTVEDVSLHPPIMVLDIFKSLLRTGLDMRLDLVGTLLDRNWGGDIQKCAEYRMSRRSEI
ncbi:hypothetical protein K439DRAFT_1637781 [Ramaria rubella]|nr:hypothetical protein K439DRAFT_1637781 [Ramaria rubella]